LDKALHGFSSEIHKDIDTKVLLPLGELKAHLDEALDEVHTKLNQHDARLSTQEERQFKSPDKSKTPVEQVDY
jgi:hypothetical protein